MTSLAAPSAVELVPTGHGAHPEEMAPSDTPYVPAKHGRHWLRSVARATFENRPCGQSLHAESPSESANFPGLQPAHDVCPENACALPMGHGTHALLELLPPYTVP